MTTTGLKFSGGPQLAARLNKLSANVRKQTLFPILRKAAEPMRDRMGQLAPWGFGDAKGGHLADSMSISPALRIGSTAGGRWEAADDFQAAVAVGPDKNHFYGLFLEYGWVHRPAPRPFMRPAFDGESDGALDTIRAELWDVLRNTAEGRDTSGGRFGDVD